jgi:hypothetical protein
LTEPALARLAPDEVVDARRAEIETLWRGCSPGSSDEGFDETFGEAYPPFVVLGRPLR